MATKKTKTSEGWYNTLRNRLGHYILGVALLIAGPVFSIYFLPRVLEGRASESWPTAKGKITDANLVETQDIWGTHFEAKVRYTFEVDGKKYNGDRLKIGGKSTNEQDAKADMRSYGERVVFVDVHYNPTDPSRCTLESGGTTWNFILVTAVGPAILLFGIFLIAIGIVMTLLARNREAPAVDAEDEEETERPKAKKAKRKVPIEEEESRPKKPRRRAAEEPDEDEEPPSKRKRSSK